MVRARIGTAAENAKSTCLVRAEDHSVGGKMMAKKDRQNGVTYTHFDSPVGTVRIGCKDAYIVSLYFGDEVEGSQANETVEDSALGKEAVRQLEQYFAGNRKVFDLPFAPEGTEFQRNVWAALCGIPYGETRSYKQIAEVIGNPKGCRAVGMANNRNPISIIIPCHRVIGANGDLVGYGGGLDKKVWLLQLEEQGE
jgi:methylated-DNA-[protein]-cysteine S-methyltransferase